MASPIIAVGDTLEIKVGTYCAGQAGINVLHYDVESVGAVPRQLHEVALDFDTLAAPLYKALIGNNASYYGVQVKRVRPGAETAAYVSAAFVGSGDVANLQALPTQVSGIITKQTALAGRSNRGRVFVPFPGYLFHDGINERPTAAYLVPLAALKTFLVASFTSGLGVDTATLDPVIYNQLTGARVEVINGRANQKWATQRRRGNYGAANPYPPF
jgi:hypothetical protein